MPKIISEPYELMKLCDINCSGPVFLRQTVVAMTYGNDGCSKVHEYA